MTGAERRVAAILVGVFAVQLVVVPAHLAHEHLGLETPHHDAGGAPHDSDHGDGRHSAGDHAVPMRGPAPSRALVALEPAAALGGKGSPDVPALHPTARLARPEPVEPRGTDPPRTHRARAPPLA